VDKRELIKFQNSSAS